MDDRRKEARKNLLKKSAKVEGIVVKGYDFNEGVNYKKIIDSFSSTGLQASNFSKAISIVKKMRTEKAKIFFGYTSNIVSSGLRESIRYLVEHKKVDVCVTTGGGIEEDIIKCLGDFYIGEFNLSGKTLRNKAINRIGNILAPNSNYVAFEEFVMPLLEDLCNKQEKTGEIIGPSDLVWKLGEKINDKRSICYWAWKNKIRIYCPTIMDGSLGDMIYFFKYKKNNFKLDIVEDTRRLNDETIGLDKSGVLVLGAGVVKHSILNAHLYRNGADYAVFINNAQEFDGSDAGAMPSEAVSWGKIRIEGEKDSVKVFGDASILFPILVAESFVDGK